MRSGASITKSIVQTYKGTYIAPSQQPTLSMTIGLDNLPVTDADVTLQGAYAIHLTKENGRYVTYSANDGKYTVTIVIAGETIDGGEVTITDGRCVADINLFTVSFISDDIVIGEKIAMYDSTVAIPLPEKGGHTFNGWYEGKMIFTSGTKVTHKTIVNALWGEDTEEHRNVTSDRLPMVISEKTEDAKVFFEEGSVKLFITMDKGTSGSLDVQYKRSGDDYSFVIESDCVGKDVLKTITVPCDIMRPGLRVECTDGSDISDVIVDNASQTVTFTSMGSSFKKPYPL